MTKNCVIIPCYNEELRLPISEFEENLTSQNSLYFCFVNDGSSDGTLNILNKLKNRYPNQIYVVDKKKNAGKASAIYTGINEMLKLNSFDIVGYLDADLATSIQEYERICTYIHPPIEFVFGSRIKRIGSHINRKLHRHLIGRVFATLSSTMLNLPVYDTQCGAKAFTSKTAKQIFNEPFISDWSFDVEIFFKFIHLVGKDKVEEKAKEIPLESWRDVGDSKVKLSYSLKLPFELLRIKRYYKKKFK
ncbi:glycosyltransferase [Apibacter muscae]|uniref:glycosyltransferase n=1 Tax=Apibacter muscae TaxID=2509004 RepID=UPI0011AD3C58|nr:glycosyltransferase [Apibacter muscae]TWP24413.1 glycosyltransferase [Apibacter muscae]